MDVIQLTRDLGKAIQEDDAYLQFTLAQNASDNDDKLQKQIGDFNMLRSQINQEMMKQDKDQAKIEEMNQKLQGDYQTIMRNPNMIAFNAAKQNVDMLMQQINAVLSGSVNGQNPEEIDIDAACGGDCAGCSGCGC